MRTRELSYAFVISLVMGLFVGYLLFHTKKINDVATNLRRSYSAICSIKAGINKGTGVLLDTGYILTAAHIFDRNGDRKISLGERYVRISFNDKDSHRARLLYYDNFLDFAILEPRGVSLHKRYGASISLIKPELAEQIYTIGCTIAQPPMLSEGRISYDYDMLGRASCFVYSGNSGGPLFDKNHNVIGIVVAMGIVTRQDSIVIPMPNGNSVIGSIDRLEPVSGVCYFSQIQNIFARLYNLGIHTTIVKPEEPTLYERLNNPYFIGFTKTCLQAGLFLIVVYYLRRDIFSSSMCEM